MIARIFYFTTIVLGLALVVASGASGSPIGLFAAFCFLVVATFKATAARIIIGILYGLAAIQIFLFTGIAVSGVPGAVTEVILLFTLSAVLLSLSVTYFTYKPLRLFLRKTDSQLDKAEQGS